MALSSSSAGPWPFPERFRLSWKLGAILLRLPSVFIGTTILKWTQKIQVKNGETLVNVVMNRKKGTPLVTVANHLSYIDDPCFYHLLPLRSLFSERKVKWTPSADEVCFTNRVSSAYFSRCHAVPIIRGNGVYQRGIDYLLQRLNEGHWIHFYPEAPVRLLIMVVEPPIRNLLILRQPLYKGHISKMNITGKYMRLKWGVGRVITEATTLPIVLPIWLIGPDVILPYTEPLIPKLFKKITVYIGEPIDISSAVSEGERKSLSAVGYRKLMTDLIQEKLWELRSKAEEMHSSWNCTSRVAYRKL